MIAGFTPGPWKADEPLTSSRRVFMPGDTVEVRDMGQQFVACLYRENFPHGADEANARLIAAAPELYGQLESGQTDLDLLRRAIEENDPKAELLIRVTDLWKRNEAALAKARGEAVQP